MLTLRGRRYDTAEPVTVCLAGDRIHSVTPLTPDDSASALPWIAPGLFDPQINGYGGTWFCQPNLTAEQAAAALEPHFQFGLTRLFPTLITASREAFQAGLTAIRTSCEASPRLNRLVAGCHLEGPSISAEDGPRGAHPKTQVRPPDWDEFLRLQEASGGRVRLVTLAPEVTGAVPFIQKAVAAGVTISIGHTAADSDQIRAAVDAGARMSTHLGNGAHGMIRRHPNCIWDQLADDRLTASLITDGHHLPAAVVRSMIRAKGPGRTVITCDSAGLAGCPPGIYQIESGPVEVLPEGRIVVAGQRQLLAGSAQLTDHCVAKAIEMAGLSLKDAFDMAGRTTCRLLGLEEARLRAGALADVVLFDWPGPGSPFEWRATIAAGELCYGTLS